MTQAHNHIDTPKIRTYTRTHYKYTQTQNHLLVESYQPEFLLANCWPPEGGGSSQGRQMMKEGPLPTKSYLTLIGVHSNMHFMHPMYTHVHTLTYTQHMICTYMDSVCVCVCVCICVIHAHTHTHCVNACHECVNMYMNTINLL